MGAGGRDAAHAQKAGDSKAGEKLSQFLGLHGTLLSAGRNGLIHSMKKANPIELINISISALVKQSFFKVFQTISISLNIKEIHIG